MKKYNSIIYDCDGTLLDSKNFTIKAYELLLERKMTEAEVEKVFHQTQNQSLRMFNIKLNGENIKKIEDLYKNVNDLVKPFPGIIDVLRTLSKRGVHQGMATNRNKEAAYQAFLSNDLNKYLRDVVYADLVKNPKPAGDMLTLYIENHGLEPDETLYVGNAISDHKAAIDAGIDFCYCEWGTVDFMDEHAIILKRPSDLLLYIEEDVYDKNFCPQRI